jgi:hypothetical protein
MRFFTRITERECRDTQELAAMLRHRLNGIAYKAQLLREGDLAYAFFTQPANEAILMYEVDSVDRLDLLIKRDPQFAYAHVETMPTIQTEALLREAQDYLGENIIPEEELPEYNHARKQIEDDATYYLAWKEVPPFSPLLSIEEQNDVHRRTIQAQMIHFQEIEFADDNPAGRPVGILIAQAGLDEVRRHVETCEVYPDTIVRYTHLLTLPVAWRETVKSLTTLGRSVPPGIVSPWPDKNDT